MENGTRSFKEVFTVVDRAGDKAFWVRVGTAFVNRDGSFNVKLDALPVNGTLQIRDPLPRDEQRGVPRAPREENRSAARSQAFEGV